MVAMASTALLGWLRHHAVIVAALATALLLICDAWFDVSLAFGTPEIWLSAALAVFVELPLAFYLIRRVTGMISLAQGPAKVCRDEQVTDLDTRRTGWPQAQRTAGRRPRCTRSQGGGRLPVIEPPSSFVALAELRVAVVTDDLEGGHESFLAAEVGVIDAQWGALGEQEVGAEVGGARSHRNMHQPSTAPPMSSASMNIVCPTSCLVPGQGAAGSSAGD
ncbi:hypothetical protein PO587_27560 [Streptomyces gilvifuscus]|uniref:Uncharacterized protein n=1 Tax=Streptomyces gilvifuscus TaxID=1550617 RepID=A0ABT5G070_9ACTN|nr:hypothetical protein [Streptomyces gilvifuscus]MDC2958204.1 hypothetical protein [Streptomyces gilvifuscus]